MMGQMPAQRIHTQLLNAAARDVLRPLGVVQRGRSRMWLDDQDWWLGVVDFQPITPPSYGRGTYLNVAVSWLWGPWEGEWGPWVGFPRFDLGGRVATEPGLGGVRFENEAQFTQAAEELAAEAAEHVRRFRALLPSLGAAAAYLSDANLGAEHAPDVAIALGLIGEADRAEKVFEDYFEHLRLLPDAPGFASRKGKDALARLSIRATQWRELCSEPVRLRAYTSRVIEQRRQALGLSRNFDLL